MAFQRTGYYNGHWVPDSRLTIAVDDLGFVQGVTAVERLRTWNGRLPPVDAHLERLRRAAAVLRIGGLPSQRRFTELIGELVERNWADEDIGLMILATPGRRGGSEPTLCLRATALDHVGLEQRSRTGQPLVITAVQQPPVQCWPRDIKVRCRIHYYLADAIARDLDPRALGVLVDQDGSVTETSTSNVLVFTGSGLVLPPADRVLPGVMAGVLCQLASDGGVRIERRVIMPEELRSAPHVWLTGSEGGLWPANEVDGVAKIIDDHVRYWQSKLTEYLSTAR